MHNDSSSPRPGLIRVLGPVTATAIVVGTVIGTGVFKKSAIVAENVPYFGVAAFVWIIVGLLALLGALAIAEVAVLYPMAGGNYVFLREAYGRLWGFLFGWVEFWMIRSGSIAALATLFAQELVAVLKNEVFQQRTGLNLGSEPMSFWAQQWLTVVVIMGLAVVNILGVRWGGLLQLFITTIKVASLIAIAVLPFIAVSVSPLANPPKPRFENLSPMWPSAQDIKEGVGQKGPAAAAAPGVAAQPQVKSFEEGRGDGGWLAFLSKIGAALVGVIWAYHGWMNIAPVAEEVTRPQRNLPIALLGGVLLIIALYLSANFAYYLIIPQDEMAQIKKTTVATVFCERLLGPIGAALASAAVMCSAFGALSGSILVGPRLLYAMGEDGLAPRSLGAAHPRFHTPARAILVLGIWSGLLILAGAALTQARAHGYGVPIFSLAGKSIDLNLPKGKELFDVLTDFAMFGSISFETLALTTIFAFRWRFPDRERPYRCPFYPWVPILYVSVLSLVLANMFWTQTTEASIGMGFIVFGAIVYMLIPKRAPVV